MKIVPLSVMLCIGSAAFGRVVIQMPAPPVTTAVAAGASSTPAVSPLQRFGISEPAKDRAGNVILHTLPATVTSGGGGNAWSSGYGYGWRRYGWGYPIICLPCVRPYPTPCEPFPPVWGGGTSVFIELSF
jgi:hypothetical protein